MMTKKYLGFAAGLLLLAGCTNNDFTDNGANVPDGQVRTISSITATLDQADTRLVLENNLLVWEGQEHAFVFSDMETVGLHDYELSYLDLKLNTADFYGDEISGSEFYAFIPEPKAVDFSANEATLRWGYDVIYDQVNYNRSIPMFAKSHSSQMQFQQLSGILHFQIYGEGRLQSLTLTGNNGEKFYQNYKLKYTADEIKLEPTNISEEEPTSVVESIMVSTDGKYQYLEEDEPFDVYFVLPAGMTFEKGFTISGVTEIEDFEKAITYTVPFEQKTTDSFTVKRAEVASFPAFSTTGDVEPEPENGWISNFCDLSGSVVSVSYYYSNSQVWWSFVFLTEDHADPIYIDIATENTGSAPSLANLDGALVTDLRMHDFSNNLIFRTDDVVHLIVKKNEDNTWYIAVKNMTIYENNGDAANQKSIYVKFNGNVNVEPPASWSFTGAAWISGAYATIERVIEEAGDFSQFGAEHSRDFVRWRLRFTNFPWGFFKGYIPEDFYEVVVIWEEEHDGLLPAFPTNVTIDDFWLDIMSNGYDMAGQYVMDDDDAQLTIHQNDDGTYEISVSDDIKMYPVDSDVAADPKPSNFSFNGVLTEKYKSDENPEGEIYINDGENSATLIFNTAYFTYQGDGLHIMFEDIQVADIEINNINFSYLFEDIKNAEIVWDEPAKEGGVSPEWTENSYLQLTDGAGNLLWQTDKDQDLTITSEGMEFYPSIKAPNGRQAKLHFVWKGPIEV